MMNEDHISCIIIDDEEFAAEVIKSHLGHIDNFKLSGVFHNPVEAFLYIEKEKVDVIFLDIQMPELTGIKMVEMLKDPPLIVFTTAHRDYALEGFELDVLDYLLKPISLARFLKTVRKIKSQLLSEAKTKGSITDRAHLFVKVNREMVKIYFDDIIYVEAIKNHVRIVAETINYISYIGLSEFYQKLENQPFLRIHRSYIINTSKISAYNNSTVRLGEHQIPIGQSYKASLSTIKEG